MKGKPTKTRFSETAWMARNSVIAAVELERVKGTGLRRTRCGKYLTGNGTSPSTALNKARM
jgi:hypothetical protein